MKMALNLLAPDNYDKLSLKLYEQIRNELQFIFIYVKDF